MTEQEQFEAYMAMDYFDMVSNLLKPAEHIIPTITNQKIDLLHACMGLAGEWKEFEQAVNNDDEENMIEEIGDCKFYCAALFMALDAEPTGGVTKIDDLGDCGGSLILTLIDLSKKIFFYDQPIEAHREELLKAANFVWDSIIILTESISKDPETHNREKLWKRYKGAYSDKAAKERADKQGEES